MKKAPAKMKKKSMAKMVKAPDSRVTTKKKGTSRSIGPQESSKSIDAKRAKVRKLSGTFSKAEEKAVGDLQKAKSFVKMKKSPAKMAKKSPAKKPLVGKQKNLPEELKKKILASPAQMKKSAMKMKKQSMAMMKKSAAMMKKASAMKMKMKSAAKMKKK
jgi:hypothetical protein